ncbi:MAG: primosomal protein N', partial [Gammaproteobacteria bacterium]|nr:primosomal protein N' [Gammaproteobacteria bacterium]
MAAADATILRLAIPAPIHGYFDYLPPAGVQASNLAPGIRIEVPFGRGRRLGLLVGTTTASEVPPARLRHALRVLDQTAVLPPDLLALLRWGADYYRQPPGEMFWSMLPAGLRQGAAAQAHEPGLALTPAGAAAPADSLRRAPRQAELLARLQNDSPLRMAELDTAARRAAAALCGRGWAARCELGALAADPDWPTPDTGPALTADQAAAVAGVHAEAGFAVHLLHGVTGSGKTEVYLRLMAEGLVEGHHTQWLV